MGAAIVAVVIAVLAVALEAVFLAVMNRSNR
jgi:hypothetical protein